MRKVKVSERRKSVWLSLFLIFVSRFAYGDFENEIVRALKNDDPKMALNVLKNDPDLQRYHDPKQADSLAKILRWAAGRRNYELVELLLDRKVDPSLPDSTGWTALHFAASNGPAEIVELLLAYGADPNPLTNVQRTPLLLATINNYPLVVETLLRLGADPNLEDREGRTPFHVAAMNGREEMVKLFLAKGSALSRDQEGLTPLHVAAQHRHANIVKQILEGTETDLNEKTAEGQTALHLAAENGCLGSVSHLLEKNADPNLMDMRGRTPLHSAIQNKREAIAELLLARNVDLVADFEGQTPLHFAAEMPRGTKIVELLLARGMNPDEADHFGNTPFLLAAVSGNLESVRYLLSHNVNPLAANQGGMNALHLAAAEGSRDVVAFLLSKGLELNGVDKASSTPLHYAAAYKREDVIRFLLNQGADPNRVNVAGQTALHYAVCAGNEKIVHLLLENQIDVNITDFRGRDALDLVAKGNQTPHYREIVKTLYYRMVPNRVQALKSSETLEEFKKHKKFVFNKVCSCAAHLDKNKKEILDPILALSKVAGNALIRKELPAQLGLNFPPISLQECDLGKGLCKVCFNEKALFACPGVDLNCSNAKCASCSLAEVEQLLVDHRMFCAQCKGKIKPKMYSRIPGCKGMAARLEERILRAKLMEDPNWKFCPGEGCLSGARFEKDNPKYLDCDVCDFKGCLECHQDHLGTCESYLEDRKMMMDLLSKGERVQMKKLIHPDQADADHPLYLEANDSRLEENLMKSIYETIQDPDDPHYYDGKFRPCPHCGVVTERIDGCNGMTCNSCGKEYHWNQGKQAHQNHDFTHGPRQYSLEEGIDPHY